MRAPNLFVAIMLAVVLVAPACTPPEGGGDMGSGAAMSSDEERGFQEEFGPYDVVENWSKGLPDEDDGVTHAGWTWGSQGAVYAESPDRIWYAQRGELPLPEGSEAADWTPYSLLDPPIRTTGNPDGISATCQETGNMRGWERRIHHVIFVVDGDGNFVESWLQNDELFEGPCARGPHKIKMSPYDPDKHVWVIDDQQHVIYKFTYDGELVMTLGTRGERGRDTGKLFDRPTDIDWLPDGTFFISDGYGGTRVAKFSPEGEFLMEWGGPPEDPDNPGPNEFRTVHSIAISADRRVYVVDRSHRRMQIFDENGEFLDMFYTGMRSSPYYHLITEDQTLWVADGGTDRILKYDLNGYFQYGWGQSGTGWGQFEGPHQISVDQDGNLYAAEVFNGRIQKFTPRPGADPAKMVGQEVRYTGASSR